MHHCLHTLMHVHYSLMSMSTTIEWFLFYSRIGSINFLFWKEAIRKVQQTWKRRTFRLSQKRSLSTDKVEASKNIVGCPPIRRFKVFFLNWILILYFLCIYNFLRVKIVFEICNLKLFLHNDNYSIKWWFQRKPGICNRTYIFKSCKCAWFSWKPSSTPSYIFEGFFPLWCRN